MLEEKLSVILKEMGVDKYSDVLDSEVAECDFTDVYMRSIGHASQVEKNLYPVEAEMKQQLTNAQKYKDVIREEKDLTKLVGTESNFDVDSALRTMLTYYECWRGHDPRLIDRISIADEEITQHLKTELVQDRTAPLMSIQIDNFPNEEGYFMLWELSISEKESGKRILPIFVNSAMVLRPMAGKRIMDVFLDGSSKLRVSSAPNVDAEIYSKLEKSCMDFAYDTFVELKEKQMQQNEESFKKYMYALELRQEAAEHIGIENIRRSRLQKLQKEKANIEAQHRKGSQVYPDFGNLGKRQLQSESKCQHCWFGWLIEFIRANFGKELPVNVCLLVALNIRHAAFVNLPQQHFRKALINLPQCLLQRLTVARFTDCFGRQRGRCSFKAGFL